MEFSANKKRRLGGRRQYMKVIVMTQSTLFNDIPLSEFVAGATHKKSAELPIGGLTYHQYTVLYLKYKAQDTRG
jgi:hypothetical protein